jgi:hypothetical protein
LRARARTLRDFIKMLNYRAASYKVTYARFFFLFL